MKNLKRQTVKAVYIANETIGPNGSQPALWVDDCTGFADPLVPGLLIFNGRHGHWRVLHVPSGRIIQVDHEPITLKEEAARVLARLGPLANWDQDIDIITRTLDWAAVEAAFNE
jgi:hypothetical protein